jgi:hypothetical protein
MGYINCSGDLTIKRGEIPLAGSFYRLHALLWRDPIMKRDEISLTSSFHEVAYTFVEIQ